VTLSDGSIRNGYTVKVANKTLEKQHYFLTLEGLPGYRLSVIGAKENLLETIKITVPGNELLSSRIYISAPKNTMNSTGSKDITFVLTDTWGGPKYRQSDYFKGPKP
jgi:polyferredoxin